MFLNQEKPYYECEDEVLIEGKVGSVEVTVKEKGKD